MLNSASILSGKTVLLTGGTGSFGQRFTQRVLEAADPKKLIVFSRDENKQWEMEQRFPASRYSVLRFFIGDIRDRERLRLAMRNVDIVIHAAALKHVPIAEYNPFECVHTNIIGAENVVRAAAECGVEKVIALSTDKAANPINLYGATKLASDKIFVSANEWAGDLGAIFSVVRYGNVLGSRGSVVELFRRLLESGEKTLPITDPRMTRFFITLEQGVEFVLSSLNEMRGGEIFVPKIPSVRIKDLCEAMAPGIPTKEIGIRRGEKLHELMIGVEDARMTYEFDDRFVMRPEFSSERLVPHYYDERGGRRPDEGFCYSSDANEWFLGVDEVRDMINADPKAATTPFSLGA